MMAAKPIARTIQYWRLVDARTHQPVEDVEWWSLIARWTGEKEAVIDGQRLTGTVHPVPSHDRMLGVVLSSDKDYLPNQRQDTTGNQAPMRLNGDGWNPVDNLFVIFLPFGNLFAVIAESVSSSRASKFADWLNRILGPSKNDPDFSWAADPVIDEQRAEILNDARGLRRLTIRAPYGTTKGHGPEEGFLAALNHKPTEIKGWSIEITITATSADSTDHDREALLKYYEDTFGGLAGHETKAVVTTSGDDSRGPTEIDLLHHRLTRKKNVQLEPGRSGRLHFAVAPVMQTLYEAYRLDRADLYRILKRKAPAEGED